MLVKFIIYSGSPDIVVGFDSELKSTATENSWLIESSMAYLLTPKLRRDKGFTGKIYMKVDSIFSSSYYLEVIINRK